MKKGKKDQDSPKHVRLYNDLIDSAAYKSLSPNSVWLLVQIKRTWRMQRGGEVYQLPRGHVRFKISGAAYTKAIRELVSFGFLDLAGHEGGLLRTAKRYKPSERWKLVSAQILKDAKAGSFVRRWNMDKDGQAFMESVWEPAKTRTLPACLVEYMERQRKQKTLLKLKQRRVRRNTQENSRKTKAKP